MLEYIDEILKSFRSRFSRKAGFLWFAIIVVGLMLRTDHLGVTSVIRDLALRSDSYETDAAFFQGSLLSLEGLRLTWFQSVHNYAALHKEDEFTILIGDGVKQAKEGRFMPAVKKLFQESENYSKAQYIFGHMFGGLGVLAGNASKWFCIPLSVRLHEGLQPAADWEGSGICAASHVICMVEDAYQAAKIFGKSLLLLDRYFLSNPALERLAQLNATGSEQMEIITKPKETVWPMKHRLQKNQDEVDPLKKDRP